MRRTMMKGKIHRATVTEACLHYEGSVTIDQDLLEAADIIAYESVDIYNVSNGLRFRTYAIEGERGKGDICLNGAAARMVSPGDLVIIASYAEFDETEARAHKPKNVFVDAQNHIQDNRHFEIVSAGQNRKH